MSQKHSVFQYEGNELVNDGVKLADIAREFGTPTFVYSAEAIRRNYRRIAEAFASAHPFIAYSVKANSNGALLRLLAREGSGFDVVSANELDRVRRAGVPAGRVIFAGVGKTQEEMRRALEAGVRDFNLESPAEADRLNDVALSIGKTAPVAIRVNPDVDAQTHEFISTGKKENKFGMALDAARDLAGRIKELRGLRLDGIHAHIGSQILNPRPHEDAANVLDEFLSTLKKDGHALKTLNFGGGFGILYKDEDRPLDLSHVARVVTGLASQHGLELLLEPGRSIIGDAGILLTRVQYIKRGLARTFVIIDGAMTEIIRPALYSAFHDIAPVCRHNAVTEKVDVVGPVCESGDFLAKERSMPVPESGEVLAIFDAGAYCSAMSSNYNSRQRPAEVLIDRGKAHLIVRRETFEDLVRNEVVPEHLA